MHVNMNMLILIDSFVIFMYNNLQITAFQSINQYFIETINSAEYFENTHGY